MKNIASIITSLVLLVIGTSALDLSAQNTPKDNSLFIEGEVRSHEGLNPLEGVLIFFKYQGKDELVTKTRTDENGYFKSKEKFKRGDIVIITAEIANFNVENRTVTMPHKDTAISLLLKYKMFIVVEVQDSLGEALEDVEISYRDRDDRWVKVGQTEDKEFNFKIPPEFGLGEDITLRAKKEGYKTVEFEYRIGKINRLTIRMDQKKIASAVVPLPPMDTVEYRCWNWKAYTALGLAAVSGTSYVLYDKSYEKYKDFKSLDRENDYDRAKVKLRIGTVTGTVAVALGTWWLVCLLREKKAGKVAKKLNGINFVPWMPANSGQALQMGIAYKF